MRGAERVTAAHVPAQGEIKKRNAGERLPASYVNFYLANGGAVIPAFGEATDKPCALPCLPACYIYIRLLR
jgi:agmatine/peptidylarginine deiminase